MGEMSAREVIEVVFTVLAAGVFLHPLHKREPFLRRAVVIFGLAVAAALALTWVLP